MGTWGYTTDSNDKTQDELVEIKNMIYNHMDKSENYNLGVIIDLIKRNLPLSRKVLNKALKDLKYEKNELDSGKNTRGWDNPEQRTIEIVSEILMVKNHIKEWGWWGDKVESKPIYESIMKEELLKKVKLQT